MCTIHIGGDRAKHALIGQCDLFAASRHSQDYTSDLFTRIGSTFMEINFPYMQIFKVCKSQILPKNFVFQGGIRQKEFHGIFADLEASLL